MTVYTTITKNEPRMTGNEKYKFIGDPRLAPKDIRKKIAKDFKGCFLHWDCIDKAKIVKKYLGGNVVVGKLIVLSLDLCSSYSFEFNPPYELHAWNVIGQKPVDFSLPGVILKGRSMKDKFGRILTGRKPCINLGADVKWLDYRPHEVLL